MKEILFIYIDVLKKITYIPAVAKFGFIVKLSCVLLEPFSARMTIDRWFSVLFRVVDFRTLRTHSCRL